MSLATGTRLGAYEIVSPLGVGGMGEVYRARDTRLDRTVAIKVSNEQFTEWVEREARAVAALNHPHICQLYDVGPDYLVMELVEGAALTGPLEVGKAVEYAEQILDALDAAHRKGITHRDLKPGNILVTKQGVKLLDFGLAKRSGVLHEADTKVTTLTREGQIAGTLQYMAPEQLQGKAADPRSDLFSFGCVLYEMLSGGRAFEGGSAADIIAAILEREPAPLLEAPQLERIVRRALAKDPDERFQTACDLKAALIWAVEHPRAPGAVQPKSRAPWVVAAALAVVAAAASWIAWRSAQPVERPPPPLLRLDVDLGSDVSLGSITGADAILSPDGTRLVYASKSRLFTRRLDQPTGTELAGTEGAFAPFFSPDGEWVAFFAGAKLKKVPVQGGAVIPLCDAPNGAGGSWGEDGQIVAQLAAVTGGLSRIPSAGGAPAPLTEVAQGEVAHRWPQVLPGARSVLFTAFTSTIGADGASIEVMSLGDRRRKTVQPAGTYGRYLPSGHLVYLHKGTLFALPFDLDRLEGRGTPVPVLERVAYHGAFGSAQLDFSRTGSLVYRSGGASSGRTTVQWLDGTGQMRPLVAKPGDYLTPSLSPVGTRLALTAAGDIWIYDWQRDTMTPVTSGGGHIHPIWSPDGRYLAFQSREGISWMASTGGNSPAPLIRGKNAQYPWSFTRDGKRLAFMEQDPQRGFDLWTVTVESEGTSLRAGRPEAFLQTAFDERHPSLSPDGRWLAYTSNELGDLQVYVRAFPDKGARWQISSSGGAYPVWSRRGGELFFRSSDNQIMVTGYTVQGDSFLPGKPLLWSEKRLANVGLFRNYDVAPDGRRIAAIAAAEGAEDRQDDHHVIFLLNFFDELRRRVGNRSQ